MKSWKTLERRIVFQHSKYLTVESHTVELADGRIISDWPWIITPDFINVIAVTTEGKWLCFRQTKYAVEGTSLAPVGGYIEPGEDPLETAKRELREEMGYEASQWIHLGSYRMGANRGIATGHFYLARDAHYVTKPQSDDLEEQELLLLDSSEVEEALVKGEFKVLGWVANVALALLYLHRSSEPSWDQK
nr:NUDIX hydrolase [Chloroflexota bacterium]